MYAHAKISALFISKFSILKPKSKIYFETANEHENYSPINKENTLSILL